MAEATRDPLELLVAAATLARVPLTPAETEQHLRSLLPLLSELDALRRLPLKEFEPPLTFRPAEP
jgi:hypothetical protein